MPSIYVSSMVQTDIARVKNVVVIIFPHYKDAENYVQMLMSQDILKKTRLAPGLKPRRVA